MSYRYSEFGHDGCSCLSLDPFDNEPICVCKVCGHIVEELIKTDQGEMCRECFDYLCEIDDDKPTKL